MSCLLARAVCFLSLAIVISGCQLINDSRGPDIKLVAADLRISTDNELNVIGDLYKRSQLSAQLQVPDPNWYYLVPAGFSYIDETCDQYLRALYDLDRNRDRFKSALLVLDKTSNAMMGATGTSIKAMQIVAQAFGGAAGLTDAFVDRYEFRNEPAIVFLTVDKLRTQFRADVAGLRDTIQSPAQVVIVLKNYLKICQPNSIEAVVNNYVAIAVANSNSEALGGVIRSAARREAALSTPAAGVALAGRPRDASSVRVGLVSPLR
jgi:hypothetical protein